MLQSNHTIMSVNVGDKIKIVRKAKKLSQQEVADKIGIDRAQYSRVETNKSKPTLTTIEKIAEALEVEVVDLFTNDGKSFDINSYEKNLVDRIRMIEELEEEQKKSIYSIIDIAIANKKYKDFFREQVTA